MICIRTTLVFFQSSSNVTITGTLLWLKWIHVTVHLDLSKVEPNARVVVDFPVPGGPRIQPSTFSLITSSWRNWNCLVKVDRQYNTILFLYGRPEFAKYSVVNSKKLESGSYSSCAILLVFQHVFTLLEDGGYLLISRVEGGEGSNLIRSPRPPSSKYSSFKASKSSNSLICHPCWS